MAEWLAHCDNREEALRRAHVESGLSMTAIAAELGLTIGRISQLIAMAEINAAKNGLATLLRIFDDEFARQFSF